MFLASVCTTYLTHFIHQNWIINYIIRITLLPRSLLLARLVSEKIIERKAIPNYSWRRLRMRSITLVKLDCLHESRNAAVGKSHPSWTIWDSAHVEEISLTTTDRQLSYPFNSERQNIVNRKRYLYKIRKTLENKRAWWLIECAK